MSRIYLSASYRHRAVMVEARRDLAAVGHEVVSRWIDDPTILAETPESSAAAAAEHLADVAACDVLIAYTVDGGGRGGRHVELGYAAALGKRILLVGPREHIFHCLPGVAACATIHEACQAIPAAQPGPAPARPKLAFSRSRRPDMPQCPAERPAEDGGVTYCILEAPHKYVTRRDAAHRDNYGNVWTWGAEAERRLLVGDDNTTRPTLSQQD